MSNICSLEGYFFYCAVAVYIVQLSLTKSTKMVLVCEPKWVPRTIPPVVEITGKQARGRILSSSVYINPTYLALCCPTQSKHFG